MQIENKNISSVVIKNNYSINGAISKYNILDTKGITVSVSTLSNIRKLANLPTIKTVSEYFNHMSEELNISGTFNYSLMLGSKKTNEYLSYLKHLINNTLNLVTNYHTELFSKRKQCYNNLTAVMFENKVLEVPVYDHTGVTGRTSIVSGYNFLTMKKENRKKIKPLQGNKVLIEVDFKSCEPFFFLKSKKFNIEGDDVYAWLCQKYEIELRDRDKVKRGILSMMYGANESTTSKIMKLKLSVVQDIKHDLGLTDLNIKLKEEYEENGFILNYYGRPITSDKNLVNYYIQSSAVDYCSLAFYDFVNKNNIDPCFFIHDSLTFQCEKNQLNSILKIKELNENVSNISIPVEFNVVYT